MPKFSEQSEELLKTCHPDLQAIFRQVIDVFDCKVLAGYRGQEEQDELYRQGKTKVQWPNGKHNRKPSMAIDVVPYPVDWDLKKANNIKRWYYFAGVVLGIAHVLGIELRWGGCWKRDNDFSANKFDDLPHFELKIS